MIEAADHDRLCLWSVTRERMADRHSDNHVPEQLPAESPGLKKKREQAGGGSGRPALAR